MKKQSFNTQNPANHHTKSLVIGTVAGICAAIIWGLWPVLTRFGVTSDFTAEEIVAVRFTFAGIILLPYYFYNQVWKRISPFKSIVIASGAGAILPNRAVTSKYLKYLILFNVTIPSLNPKQTYRQVREYHGDHER